jgi:hypothetical protein
MNIDSDYVIKFVLWQRARYNRTMFTGEKYPEQLSESERDVLGLCSEIVKWTDPVYLRHYPGILELKDEATDLYADISRMDYVNDDDYYKVSHRAERVRAKFEALKKEIEEKIAKGAPEEEALIRAEFERGATVPKIMEELAKQLVPNAQVEVVRTFVPESEDYEGDSIRLWIKMPPIATGYCERLQVNEDFASASFAGHPILEGFAAQPSSRLLDIRIRKHEDRDQLEGWGHAEDVPLKQALNITRKLLELVQKTSRRWRPGEEEKCREYYGEEGIPRSVLPALPESGA